MRSRFSRCLSVEPMWRAPLSEPTEEDMGGHDGGGGSGSARRRRERPVAAALAPRAADAADAPGHVSTPRRPTGTDDGQGQGGGAR